MGYRSSYWSCTKFAKWIRDVGGAIPTPKWGTSEQWNEYDRVSEEQSPFVHWLAGDGLNAVQDFVFYIPKRLDDLRAYLANRFVWKHHYARTGVKPGDYAEADTKLMQTMFLILVDYVESECAWHHAVMDSEEFAKLSWWDRRWWVQYRNPEMGLAYLEWERSLSNGDGQGASHQAIAAEEVMALYAWWTVTLPNRKDPMSFIMEDLKARRGNRGLFGATRLPKNQANWDKMHALEKAYKDEDDAMMIRLVRIRDSLWT